MNKLIIEQEYARYAFVLDSAYLIIAIMQILFSKNNFFGTFTILYSALLVLAVLLTFEINKRYCIALVEEDEKRKETARKTLIALDGISAGLFIASFIKFIAGRGYCE